MKEINDKTINFMNEVRPQLIYKKIDITNENAVFSEKISEGFAFLLRNIVIVHSKLWDNGVAGYRTGFIDNINVEIKNVLHNFSRCKGNDYFFSNNRRFESKVPANCLCGSSEPIAKHINNYKRRSGEYPEISALSAESTAFSYLKGSRKYLNYLFMNGETLEVKFSINGFENLLGNFGSYGIGNKILSIDFLMNGYYIPENEVL